MLCFVNAGFSVVEVLAHCNLICCTILGSRSVCMLNLLKLWFTMHVHVYQKLFRGVVRFLLGTKLYVIGQSLKKSQSAATLSFFYLFKMFIFICDSLTVKGIGCSSLYYRSGN